MEVNILLFGQIADMVGTQNLKIHDVGSTEDLKCRLVSVYPILKDVIFSVAVNKVIVHNNTILNEGDVVALMPPYSGG